MASTATVVRLITADQRLPVEWCSFLRATLIGAALREMCCWRSQWTESESNRMRALRTGFTLLICAATSFSQQVKRVDDGALKNAAKSGDEWLTYGRDYAETHYSPLKQIDTTNVSRLGLAWSWETDRPAVEEWKARR